MPREKEIGHLRLFVGSNALRSRAVQTAVCNSADRKVAKKYFTLYIKLDSILGCFGQFKNKN